MYLQHEYTTRKKTTYALLLGVTEVIQIDTNVILSSENVQNIGKHSYM
jgi:hypothetical protein